MNYTVAGVRERRRLRDQRDLRCRSSSASEHRQRVGPRRSRRTTRARRQLLRRDRSSTRTSGAARAPRPAARPQHVGDVSSCPRRTAREYHDRSSTRIRCSSCSTWATCRSSTACCAKTYSGRSARSAMIVRNQAHVPEELEGLEKALKRHLLLQLLDVPVGARCVAVRFFSCSRSVRSIAERRAHASRHARTSRAIRRQRSIRSSILRDVKHVLRAAPEADKQDYYLGIFLSRYQESSDLHNLFGDTNTCTSSCRPRAITTSKKSSPVTRQRSGCQFVDYSPTTARPHGATTSSKRCARS